MSTSSSPASRPRAVPMPSSSSESSQRGRGESPRAVSTARLASPVPSHVGTPQIRQIPTPNELAAGTDTGNITPIVPLAGATAQSPAPGPGISALAAQLSASLNSGQTPARFGTPPVRTVSPDRPVSVSPSIAPTNLQLRSATPRSNYGSFDRAGRSVQGNGWAGPNESTDPEIVKKHLVQPTDKSQADHGAQDGIFGEDMSVRTPSPAGKGKQAMEDVAPGLDDNEFSSLRLQGGDTTRPIYKWSEEATKGRGKRSRSFHLPRPEPENETLDIGSIKLPGGMRRNYIHRAIGPADGTSDVEDGSGGPKPRKPFTKSFVEFISIYGHYAGEELLEDDEVLKPGEYFGPRDDDIPDDSSDEEDRQPMEDSALLTPGRRKRVRKEKVKGETGPMGATLLLLKSFVGTGVLFLPKAYLNGGMLFSNLVLLFVAILSYYCFILLVHSRLKVEASFGDIGGQLYGNWMRNLILGSIVLSQIGFVAAYIVFTSENLQAFILAVTNCDYLMPVWQLILIQMAIFLPFSLLRDISKLGFTALVADAFILIGLCYLYYYDIYTIVKQHGVSDIVNFNPNDWTLFIGTAIFTFEGIGLIIPIQESMKDQRKFAPVLGGVMVIITVIFISMGALSYAAYGSATETVVILNLPQDSKLVNGVQFLYSVAILLSTPLQIFPAIKITENELFTKSGKYNPRIKWQKNSFRFLVVALCAVIAYVGANDLDKFVSVVGSFACVPLVYIYPVSSSIPQSKVAVN